jgi:hypothetical protein
MSYIHPTNVGAMMLIPTGGYPSIHGEAAWRHFANEHDMRGDPYYNPRNHLTMEQIPPADIEEVMQRFPPGTMFGTHHLPEALKKYEFKPK